MSKTTKRGGARKNSGPIKVKTVRKTYLVPEQFAEAAHTEIKAVIKKYREQSDDYKQGMEEKAARAAKRDMARQ